MFFWPCDFKCTNSYLTISYVQCMCVYHHNVTGKWLIYSAVERLLPPAGLTIVFPGGRLQKLEACAIILEIFMGIFSDIWIFRCDFAYICTFVINLLCGVNISPFRLKSYRSPFVNILSSFIIIVCSLVLRYICELPHRIMRWDLQIVIYFVRLVYANDHCNFSHLQRLAK